MYPKIERRMAAKIAKGMARICIRDTYLEELHRGDTPKTKTGDYSDVRVIDGFGTETPWIGTSRINNEQMKTLMKQIVNRLYTWHIKSDELALADYIERLFNSAQQFDEPELDQGFIRLINKEYEKQG